MRTYDQYVRAEWSLFCNNPDRAQAVIAAVNGMEINQVLDIGCGAGQELLPFVDCKSAFGVALDIEPEVGRAGRDLFASINPNIRVAFVRGGAEALPFTSGSFDVVVCRLALPYTNNNKTIVEIARVLRTEGRVFLKIHHLRYYVRDLQKSITSLNLPLLVHTIRVLLAGCFYRITGYQPRNFPSSETFQTLSLLRKELLKAGLLIVGEMKDSNPLTPSFVIVREGIGIQHDQNNLRTSLQERNPSDISVEAK